METQNAILELPVQLTEIMLGSIKKSGELTMNYMQELEKNQRDYVKSISETLNTVMPGESKLWEMQTGLMDQGMKMYDKFYTQISSMWK